MLRKILASKTFRVLILILGVIVLFSGEIMQANKPSVKGNNNDMLYVQTDAVTNLAKTVVNAHTKIFWWNYTATKKQVTQGGDGTAASFLAGTQRLLWTDVIQYLDNSSNKENALDSYTSQLDNYLSQGDIYVSDIQSVIQEQSVEYNLCAESKREWDSLFYQWLNWWDSAQLQLWLEQSQTNGMCEAKARITMNAYKAILSRLENSMNIMQSLSSSLTSNRSIIIDNFDLFRDTHLEELLAIRTKLRSLNATSAYLN